MDRKISHKVGVKLFTKGQFENVLPTYMNLFHKIDACRNAAREELDGLRRGEKRHYQYNFMYDNVFSILGKRGTGKTSVVFTLQRMIREEYGVKTNDVVLPLIMPEAIPDNCTVLGWILAIVREEVKTLEGRIEALEKGRTEDGFWNKCQYGSGLRKEISLSDRLDLLNQFFYAKSYNPSSESSYFQAIDNSVSQTVDYYRFAQGIADFWDAWIQRICHLHRLEGKGEEVCPLIYFIFDDVDLAPEKIDELLSVIIKYLSHPNIIVLTTADEELFLEVIENRLDQKIGRLPREWRNYLRKKKEVEGAKYLMWPIVKDEPTEKNQEDLVSQTTRMYLGKVLPSSTRYYLKLFHTAKQKERFCLEDGKNLADGVEEQVQRLINAINLFRASMEEETQNKEENIKGKELVNFMKPGATMINFYLMFMGNTSRQIANAYIALQELIDNLVVIIKNGDRGVAGKQSLLSDIYQNSRYFLSVAIRANHELAEVIEAVDDFVDEVFLPEYNQWRMYINYGYASEFLKKNLDDGNKPHKIEIGLQLYALLSFQENIMLLMERGVQGGITQRKKIHVVRFLTDYVENVALNERHVFRNDLDPNIFFGHYVNLLDRLPVIAVDEMSEQKFSMEYFYNFLTDQYEHQNVRTELIMMRRNNRKFYTELVGMLSMVYGNAYLFDRQNMENCLVFLEEGGLTGWQIVIHSEIRQNIIQCFGVMKMHEVWEWDEGYFWDAVQSIPKDNNNYYFFAEEIRDNVFKEGMLKNDDEEEYMKLSEIVSSVMDAFLRNSGNVLEENPFSCCPADILNDFSGKSSLLDDRKEKENLILNYTKQMKEAERSIGKMGTLYDPENVIAVLRNLADKHILWREQIYQIVSVLKDKTSLETGEILIPKKVYFDIARIMTNALERGLAEEDAYSDNAVTAENIKEILANMDIAVLIKDKEDFYAAVKLGLQMLALEYLESAYIYQTIYERYEDNNNESSRDLERTSINGQKEDTYYYKLFNFMADLVEEEAGEEPADNKRNNARNITRSNMGMLEAMKDEIVAVCSRERQRYVDGLIRGDKPEQWI